MGTINWLAATGFRFTRSKILILGTYTDVYKANAYSWLLTGYCNKNYSRYHFVSLFSTYIAFMTTDARLQTELAESRNEIQRLRERLSMGMPTVYKNLFLISFIAKWSGLESAIPLEGIFEIIESSAQIGRWD